MKRIVVGVGYKKDRGKDQLCDFILNQLRMDHPKLKVRKIGFADKVKDVAFQLYGWAGLERGIYYDKRRDLKEKKIDVLGRSPRELYILIGNGMREVYPHTWVDFALRGVDADIVLIKDMGFTNEACSIRATPHNLLIRIDREGPLATDPREVELDTWDEWDYIVDNSGDLKALNTKAVDIAEEIAQMYSSISAP